MTSYYQKHKELWKSKYNKTEYNNTKSKRNRKFILVIPLPNGQKLKFRSFKDIKQYAKKEPFVFERDFKELIQV